MKENKLIISLTIIFFLILFFLILILTNSIIKPHPSGLPDWVLKPRSNYSDLYCGVFSSNNTFLESYPCQSTNIYSLHEGYYRIKSIFGPTNIDSDVKFAVFNISYKDVIYGNLTNSDLSRLEIENPYEQVYFCGKDNTPQIYWDCISKDNSKDVIESCMKPFYNFKINLYIDDHQLDSNCIRIV